MLITKWCYSIPKRDNRSFENADAYRMVPSDTKALAAVADGVGSSLYAPLWARLLVRRFTMSPDDWWTDDGFSQAIAQASEKWRKKAIDNVRRKYGDSVPWWVEDGLVKGASSTMLGVQIWTEHDISTEPLDIRWRAVAVGDSCLFHVRDDRCLLSFPLFRADQFTFHPPLAHTATWQKQSKPEYAEGVCEEGDILALTTDALAQAILKALENGNAEIWRELFSVKTKEEWCAYVAKARECGDLHDDDTTLVVMRIGRPIQTSEVFETSEV